ncbi:MAG: sigma-70 family RNA polymerase sigma factor [Planctomycetes bacterium]|nr:sigma-70 family RNA polymerase sigma factor [Planctomycetota bacterium]MCB9888895.1 sigma-70 family RNA polymerase sigma factor [Planctomycetota bacterium]
MSSLSTLVQQASNGDVVAIDELIVRHFPELRAFLCLRMGRSLRARESASDLAQSVCREVLEELAEFEYRGDRAFKRWLFLRAHRKLVERARFHGTQKRDVDREALACEPSVSQAAMSLLTPSRVAAGKEEYALFEELLDGLSPQQRQVLILCRGLGMQPAEAAEELGTSANTVRVALHRALAKVVVARRRRHREDSGDGETG